ncbi:hypothetical protein [Virgibacillus proomii]|uniref:hypothetical protein n=1 Tax=Virgibacillus proomii TaxID=84407 RepID=UPI0009860819|nr:hypothetical protein [Virgibacillus proomii]
MKGLSPVKPYINVVYWILLLLAAVVAILFILSTYTLLIKNWYITLTSIISLIGSFITLKDISVRFQKFLYKSKVILQNKQVAWSITSNYKGETISIDTFNTLKTFLKDLGVNNFLIKENDSDIYLSVDGITFHCSYRAYLNDDVYSDADTIGEIIFYIPEYHAPYVEANVLLEERLIPILNELKSKMGDCTESFNFEIYFKDYHPYLGLYLKDIKRTKDFSFNFSYKEEPSSKGIEDDATVTVSKDRLSLKTKTLYTLNRLIQKHLFLSGG